MISISDCGLVKGTKIIMGDGSLKPIETIVSGEKVQTLNGPQLVLHTWTPDTIEKGTPTCYEVTFSDKYKVTACKTHKFLSTSGWVQAIEPLMFKLYDAGDKVVKVLGIMVVGKKPIYDITIQNVGHYMTENGVVHRSSSSIFQKKEEEET